MIGERLPVALDRSNGREIAIIVAILAILPLFPLSNYEFDIVTRLLIFVLFAVALNIIFGHTDQLFLFVGGLGAVGAYTTAILGVEIGITPWATLPIGVLFAGFIGATVSYVAARRNLTVILIAIFTFAFQLAIIEVIRGASDLTGGTVGMRVDQSLVGDEVLFYYVFLGVLVGFLLLYAHLVNTRFGYATMAIRQDEVAASSVGVDPVRYKVMAGGLGAMMIGLVGALYGLWDGSITPGSFQFLEIDVLVLIMVTLGGLRTLSGPVVGAALVMWIEEYLGPYVADVLPTEIRWTLVIFGGILVVLYLNFRDGIVPWAKTQWRRYRSADVPAG